MKSQDFTQAGEGLDRFVKPLLGLSELAKTFKNIGSMLAAGDEAERRLAGLRTDVAEAQAELEATRNSTALVKRDTEASCAVATDEIQKRMDALKLREDQLLGARMDHDAETARRVQSFVQREDALTNREKAVSEREVLVSEREAEVEVGKAENEAFAAKVRAAVGG